MTGWGVVATGVTAALMFDLFRAGGPAGAKGKGTRPERVGHELATLIAIIAGSVRCGRAGRGCDDAAPTRARTVLGSGPGNRAGGVRELGDETWAAPIDAG
jgi:hypothetical protein